MRLNVMRPLILLLIATIIAGCGGAQSNTQQLDTRPLEENKALQIIASVLTERGYTTNYGEIMELSNGVQFPCDFRVNGHTIAVEYLTEKNAYDMGGGIPPAAPGSRLHVLPAKTTVQNPDPQAAPTQEALYVFIMEASKYVYHYNPTSDHRADVTYHEVENRIRRDIKDFLSWYESTRAVQQ